MACIYSLWQGSLCLDLPLPEKSLPHLRDNRKFRIHDVRNLKLHCLAQQQAGAALIESVVGHQPPHQFRRRVLHRLIARELPSTMMKSLFSRRGQLMRFFLMRSTENSTSSDVSIAPPVTSPSPCRA